MSFRIDPLGAGMPTRMLRVKPVSSRRDEPAEDRAQRREQDRPAASYAPASEPLVDAYGPRVPSVRAALAASTPNGGDTPPWVAALLKAR